MCQRTTHALTGFGRLVLICLTFLHFMISGSVRADDLPEVRISADPNIWYTQIGVIIGEGWDVQSGFRIVFTVTPGPAQNFPALVSGRVDGANINSAAVVMALSHGVPLKIVSLTYTGDISLIAHASLAESDGETAIAKLKSFRKSSGRNPVIVTNPLGSISELALKRWLEREWPDYLDSLTIINAGDQSQLQQIFMSDRADACAGFGSLPWLFRQKDPGSREIALPGDLAPVQPGGFFVVRRKFAEEHPEIVKNLSQLFEKATELVKSDPARASAHIDRYLTSHLVPKEILLESLRGRRDFVGGDSKKVDVWLNDLATYLHQSGYMKVKPNLTNVLAEFHGSEER